MFGRVRSAMKTVWRKITLYNLRKQVKQIRLALFAIAGFMIATLITATIQLGSYFKVKKDVKEIKDMMTVMFDNHKLMMKRLDSICSVPPQY